MFKECRLPFPRASHVAFSRYLFSGWVLTSCGFLDPWSLIPCKALETAAALQDVAFLLVLRKEILNEKAMLVLLEDIEKIRHAIVLSGIGFCFAAKLLLIGVVARSLPRHDVTS